MFKGLLLIVFLISCSILLVACDGGTATNQIATSPNVMASPTPPINPAQWIGENGKNIPNRTDKGIIKPVFNQKTDSIVVTCNYKNITFFLDVLGIGPYGADITNAKNPANQNSMALGGEKLIIPDFCGVKLHVGNVYFVDRTNFVVYFEIFDEHKRVVIE